MALLRAARSALRSSRHVTLATLCPTGRLLESQAPACIAGAWHLEASCNIASTSGHAVIRSFASSSIENEMHDDFQPQIKTEPAAGASDQIKQDIGNNKVFIYMKGDPSAPQCGFSNMACRILDAYGVNYESRNVLADPDVREAVKTFTEWPTIPQVFVNGEFVGGSDILLSMHQSGDLFSMLESSGAKPMQPRT